MGSNLLVTNAAVQVRNIEIQIELNLMAAMRICAAGKLLLRQEDDEPCAQAAFGPDFDSDCD